MVVADDWTGDDQQRERVHGGGVAVRGEPRRLPLHPPHEHLPRGAGQVSTQYCWTKKVREDFTVPKVVENVH